MNLELTHGLESVVVVGATKERLFDAKYLERRQKTSVCCLQDLSRQREWRDIQSLCDEDLLPLCNPWPGTRSVIIMDNATIHKLKVIKFTDFSNSRTSKKQ